MTTIRLADLSDLDAVRYLFRDTIRISNIHDYNARQIEIWSSNYTNIERWERRLKEQYFLVAEKEERIAAMISLAADGYLDLMYVHPDFQRQGIAYQLITQLEKQALQQKITRIYADVSITARPFFEKMGYSIVTEQQKLIKEVVFTNYLMASELIIDN